MEILSVSNNRIGLDFDSVGRWRSNKVNLITGPNGSGKTELLTTLADTFRGARKLSSRSSVLWKKENNRFRSEYDSVIENGPSRIITQTFSPFTRFPRPLVASNSLTSIYSHGMSSEYRYLCIGLHKQSRYVGAGLSRRVLEEAIFRLSETPESTKTIHRVMRSLGFSDLFRLTYEVTSVLKDALRTSNEDRAVRRIQQEFESKDSPNIRIAGGLVAELRRSGWDDLAPLLTEALRVLGPEIRGSTKLVREFGGADFRDAYEYASLQSLALLRRLNLLTLKSFELAERSTRPFDVASASSGQQQMLCSVIGLASALKDQSLVLIDEPELSLHPRWQQQYLQNLKYTLEPFDSCHVLIATHSPLIVQQGLRLRAGVIQMATGRQESTKFEPDGMPQSSVEGTLMDVFDTPVTDSVQLASKIFNAITEAENGDDIARQRSLLSLEHLREIYQDPAIRDDKSQVLIAEAISLLQTLGQDNA